MSAQARRAYEKFAEVVATAIAERRLERREFPPFELLPDFVQEGWREAIAAGIDEPRGIETLTEEQGTVELARTIKALLPSDRGFLLWTVDYGAGGSLAYVSSCSREDAIRTVREWLKYQGAL